MASQPAPFSRLQLAAALLEYDNDPDDPEAPYRSAHESAIFSHLRRNAPTRPPAISRKSDYQGSVYPDTNAIGTEAGYESRRSRMSKGSIDALHNPFAADDNVDSEHGAEEEELQVDLASWGLDAFMPKVESKKKGKGKATSTRGATTAPSVRSRVLSQAGSASGLQQGRRSLSIGGLPELADDAVSPSENLPYPSDERRKSISSAYGLAGYEETDAVRASAPTPPLAIPFPSRSVRSPSPVFDDDGKPLQRASSFEARTVLQDDNTRRERAMSSGSLATALLAEDNPFALQPPSHVSRFDPKAAALARARTPSNGSMGSRILLGDENDNDAVSTLTYTKTQERRYTTTLELMRPKVLVMPSPLQPVSSEPPPPPAREGFMVTTDGRPLPPGARTGNRRNSLTLSIAEQPIASNLFTPNPLTNLSLSQMTFRNTLMVGGQGFGADDIPRATQDGEQADLGFPMPDDEQGPSLPPDDPNRTKRPAGKLYGKSLIDDLENRKAQLRSKQRVFTGDERPSMMARQAVRSTTLIDPSALQTRPPSQHLASYGSQPGLSRRNSAGVKPLLNFDEEGATPNLSPPGPRPTNSRSVFGVDTLWEREMVKLREIEQQERIDAEEQRKREEARELKKKGKKSRRKAEEENQQAGEWEGEPREADAAVPNQRVSAEPPVLPGIPPVRRPPPPRNDADDDSESEESDDDLAPATQNQVNNAWVSESSGEDEDGPRRTTGTGPRFPSKTRRRPTKPVARHDSDEENLPLAATINRASAAGLKGPKSRRPQDSDDDEKPLASILETTKLSLPPINFDGLLDPSRPRIGAGGGDDEDDDDNQPLGLRASRVVSGHEDDDDRPLAFHPEQQRRTQYQMMAHLQMQQQQQQQQMMMQAQMQSSMFFNAPPMMSPGFFPQQVVPPMMMQPPMPIPSPPPMHDEAKYGRVNRWRYDVAVEGTGS